MRQAAQKEVAAWIAAAVFVASMWFWHIPAAYDWALANPLVHVCEHVTLLASAIFFWRVILTSGDRRLSPATAVILVSLVGIQGSFLAALIMFAPDPLYAAYAANGPDDQALSGILMCIPASFIYLGSTVWALSRMMGNGRSDAR
jgi:putative membrane protein